MASQESIANSIKIWAFPTLATALSVMIWADVREIQSDVKHLMAESNISGTKIENVESRVDKLEQAVFVSKFSQSSLPQEKKKNDKTVKMYAVLKNDDEESKKRIKTL